MQSPLEIVFEDMDPSDALGARLREEAAKLELFTDRITSMRTVVAKPHRQHQKGNTYRVRVHITMQGASDVIVNRDPGDRGAHEDVYVTIRDAFSAARRQLQDRVRKLQGHVKEHEIPPHGVIATLVPDEDHGFISTSDGREIYFHRNAVADEEFDALEVGQKVRFSEDRGDKGPQASFVRPIGKH
ncbi:MAG: HPF/RaiA family ribosome-associated protein [Alphaproteobacteria bacterium]|nr:HPF/RaiA family ribosome-associated protein [Alphaproteobacteria bacterium]